MRRAFSLLTTSVAVVLMVFAIPAMAGVKEKKKVEKSTEVIKEIMAIPEKGIPPTLLQKAEGIAIVPGMIKVGFGIGGRHGRGVMTIRKGRNNWSNPTFISLTGGSIGWQIGAQSTDIILIFMTKKSVEDATKGKFTLGADASIAAGPVGRHAEMATDVTLKSEIYSYSRTRGLFAGIALEGAALLIDDDANVDYYNNPNITAKQIFSNKTRTPHEAAKLKEKLSSLTGR